MSPQVGGGTMQCAFSRRAENNREPQDEGSDAPYNTIALSGPARKRGEACRGESSLLILLILLIRLHRGATTMVAI